MGYDIHITRKALWSDEEGPLIPEVEWRKLIESDADANAATRKRKRCSASALVKW
jgi:hypothetical protein